MRLFNKLLLIALAAILVACAQDDNSRRTTGPAQQPSATPSAPQPLVIWHAYEEPERSALEQIRRDFEIAHPAIDVQLVAYPLVDLRQEFRTAVLAGAGPDLIIGPAAWLPSLIAEGLLEPLRDDLVNWTTSRVPDSVVFAAAIDEIPYGAVISAELVTLYANADLLPDAHDLAIFEDVRAAAGQHGLIITPSFFVTSGFFFAEGGILPAETGSGALSQALLEAYLTNMQVLAAAPGITFSTDYNAFLAGQTGLLLASSADYPRLKAALGDDLEVVALPRLVPRPWQTLLAIRPVMLSLNATAAAIDAANAFIESWLSPEAQRTWFELTGQTPANPAGLDDAALVNAWRLAQPWAVAAPLSESFIEDLQPALDQAVRAVTLEGADPAAVAAQLAGN